MKCEFGKDSVCLWCGKRQVQDGEGVVDVEWSEHVASSVRKVNSGETQGRQTKGVKCGWGKK